MTTFDRREWPIYTSRTFWTVLLTSIALSSVVLMKVIGEKHFRIMASFRRMARADLLALVAATLALLAIVCLYLISRMVVVKARVHNSADPSLFSTRRVSGSVQQDCSSNSLTRFRSNLENVLRDRFTGSLSEAVAILQWVRRQQSQDPNMWKPPFPVNHEDPNRLLEEQRRGVPGSCRRFSYILLGALLSAGFDARVVCFTNRLFSPNVQTQSHVVVEVWIEELGKWILLDPSFDTLIVIDGNVASAFELHQLVVLGQWQRLRFERNGSALEPHPNPAAYMCCRHLFVALSNAIFDGYGVRLFGPRRINFLHYSGVAPYPTLTKQILLGACGGGFFFSLVFGIWTLLSLAHR